MASTFDKRQSVSAPQYREGVRIAEIEVDGADTAFGDGIAQNETVSLYDFPAGAVILGAQMKVITAQATVTDVDLGISTDGSTNASLLDGVSVAATGYVGVTLAAPVYCNATNQLVFTNKDAQPLATGKVKIMVAYLDMAPLL